MTKLIEITSDSDNVTLDICYATNQNVTGKPLYKRAACFLHPEALKACHEASALAKAMGLKLRIYDAFRPLEAQQMLWDYCKDPAFVSPPKTGKIPHCRGIAIDLTLETETGNLLDMGTQFDSFTPQSYHKTTDISFEAQKNRWLLLGMMHAVGFEHNPREWWHYQLPNYTSYPALSDEDANTMLL